jgi:hypothetical protein
MVSNIQPQQAMASTSQWYHVNPSVQRFLNTGIPVWVMDLSPFL